MTTLVTGAAGFIGHHVARTLAARGEAVVGIDNLNDFYDTELKRRRLAELEKHGNFTFRRAELAERGALEEAAEAAVAPVRRVIHLAAQANVRYALENPHAYVDANVLGHLNVLEFCRGLEGLDTLVYASSSSVYGGDKIPFAEGDVTDRPASLYAVTKKAAEMMSGVHARLFGLPQVGLRFFSVYGPWGRPDMAYWLFTEAILAGRPIKVFGHGAMRRDFTYIDDIVAGVLAAAHAPPPAAGPEGPHRIYNIGRGAPVGLLDMVAILERLLGREAVKEYLPLQPGEVPETFADISAMRRDFGFSPQVELEDGLARFVAWFRPYRGL